jgi:glycosyltransferase involved in cell wall biosynthesis
MKMSFSVVLPVHNEEAMLRLTLNSIYALNPDEMIFCMDRCTDRSEELIKNSAEHRGLENRLKLIRYGVEDGRGWRFRSAYLRRDAYMKAEKPIIVNTSADINLDPRIPEIIKQIPDPYALISLGYFDRWTTTTFINRLKQKVRGRGSGGLIAVSRDAWLRTEDLEDLKKIPQGEDDHLRLAIKKRYKVCNITTRSLHLRPNTHPLDQYLCGVDYWKLVKASPHRMVLRAITSLHPNLLLGYRHAREVEKCGGDLNLFAESIIKIKRSQLNEL